MKSCITLLARDCAVGSNRRTPRERRVSSSHRTQVQPADPRVEAPGSSQVSSKRFLSRRSNLLPQRHTSGCTGAPGPVQTRWLGGENEGSPGIKEETGGGKGAGGGFGHGGEAGQASCCILKGGEEVMEAEKSWLRKAERMQGAIHSWSPTTFPD